MESVAILIAAVFLVLLLLVAWHARVRAVQEAERLQAEATRGRELESMAMDAASLLAATLQSLGTARDAAETDDARGAIGAAEKAAGALSSLFSAARLYLQDHQSVVQASADGCVRVAIAVARSRGWGISVRGEETALTYRGRPRPACELILELLESGRSTLGPDEFVEVELGADGFGILGGSAGALAIPADRLASLGWTSEVVDRDGRCGVRIRAEGSEDRPRDARIPEGAFGTVH